MAWHLLKSGGQNEEFGFAHKEFLIDSDSDINNEPTQFGPISIGSFAHTPGFGAMYEKSFSGEWANIPSGKNEYTALELEDYPVYNCTVRDSNLLTVSGTAYKSVQIPVNDYYDKITLTANSSKATVVCFLKTSLPDTVTNNLNITSYFATGENGRHLISAGETETFIIPSDTKYILIHILSNNESTLPDSVIVRDKFYKTIKDKLRILVLGNSFSQDSFAYLPPVLNELLPHYEITYGVAYSSSASVQTHVDMHNNSLRYAWFNYWKPGDTAWTRFAGGGNPDNGKTLTDILAFANWDIIYVQPNGALSGIMTNVVYPGRRLIRLLNSLVDHPFTIMMGQWLVESNVYVPDMKEALETVKNSLGINHIIPIGTGIANARSNSTLVELGDSTTYDPPQMLYDNTHQQSGLPALISTYVIANYLLKILGFGTKSVYNSTFMPTTANCIAINAYKEEGMVDPLPMTHGASVGVTTDNVKAAQEIAAMAINNPFVVTDCSDILDLNPEEE